MGEGLDKDDVIRQALAVNVPHTDGQEVIVTSYMTDSNGNTRRVDVLSIIPEIPPNIILGQE